ncbi:FAD-dependent monooxygenase [Paeniglutamicibacter sp. Y32M11]|uniref:FAD-dependent monooxygenase n=1 Tax=Paeniglutamicibacter sp. Y32M11 TaxID=2853258 RepID=UPI0021042978|nr:FAD-dependent monooxygenase [Paeniglutamicibacter sp. Y32M11]
MDATLLHTDVLVIGAGPTGLMAGAWLQKFGIPALVIDPKSGPTRESRALALQARSMEIYRQLGLAEKVKERAVPAGELRPGIGARSFKSIKLNRLGYSQTAYAGLTMLEQSANEELLSEQLAAGGHDVLWGHGFDSLQDTGEHLLIKCTGPNGPVDITASYVIAADGASSPVRESLDIKFKGNTNDEVFYVLDAQGVTGTGSGINLRFSEENFMLGFPMGPGADGAQRRRLLGILHDPATASQRPDIDEDRARNNLRDEFGIRYSSAAWFATYRVHHRVAEHFAKGRVFLAGDAAHIHSPVGAQGMNTGLQDAHNLVCKLADVLTGRMPESYLARYEAERRPVALRLVATTDKLFAAATANTTLARLVRTRLLPMIWPIAIRLMGRIPAGRRAFGYLSQIRIHYWMDDGAADRATLATGFARTRRRGAVLGRRLPWVPNRSGEHPDNFEVLNDASWQVHIYGPLGRERGQELADEYSVPLHEFAPAPKRSLPDGSVVLVRPDMFVAHFEVAST